MSRPLALPLCLLLACSGNDYAAPAASPQSAGTPATDKSVVQPTTNSPAEAAPKQQTIVAHGGTHTGPVPGPSDPSWFQQDLFPGAAVTSSGRTQIDEQGLFSTQMLLALPAGTTREACVDTLHKAVSPAVPNLEKKDKDGRIQLSGSNDDYQVTLLCGEGKGSMSAYLSFRWLRAPQAPPATP
ncbi:hypothetical protein [Nannocystis sp.]|uniref:hypothetical protein n=1 Tax=Nannocystis sp. TaxID=1962667 RepID=UPI002423A4B1|nr:hypothetical protein [Nannocystis sp.]MBK7824895.1 hypothetical protein [Nannocystis sp.]MBK9752851.1 hypothetical protein [Nannocystis sp.]